MRVPVTARRRERHSLANNAAPSNEGRVRKTAGQKVSSVAAVAWMAVEAEVYATHTLEQAACSVAGCGARFEDAP